MKPCNYCRGCRGSRLGKRTFCLRGAEIVGGEPLDRELHFRVLYYARLGVSWDNNKWFIPIITP